jgi:hypothetical protein
MLLLSTVPRTSLDVSEFEVPSLPDSPTLPRSWAGRLPIPDTEKGNSIFFWLFEAQDPAYDENLISVFPHPAFLHWTQQTLTRSKQYGSMGDRVVRR